MRNVDVRIGDMVVWHGRSGYVVDIYAIDSDVYLIVTDDDGGEHEISHEVVDAVEHRSEPQDDKMSVVIPVVGGTGVEKL